MVNYKLFRYDNNIHIHIYYQQQDLRLLLGGFKVSDFQQSSGRQLQKSMYSSVKWL